MLDTMKDLPRGSVGGGSSSGDSKPETLNEPEVNKRRKSAQPQKTGISSTHQTINGPCEILDGKPDTLESRCSLPPLQPRTNTSPTAANKGPTMAASNGSGSEEAFHHHFDLEVNLDEPVANLVKLIQRSLNFDLAPASILLCGLQKLTRDMCLKDCTKDGSSGLAKVKLVATNFPKEKPIINIVDVLQPLPTEGAPTIKQERTPPPPVSRASVSPTIEMQKTKSRPNRKRGISYPRPTAKGLANSPKAPDSAEWVSAESFTSLRTSAGFSADPREWHSTAVCQWLSWASKALGMPKLNTRFFSQITGAELCTFTREMFAEAVGSDVSDAFWKHFELLCSTHQALIPASSENKVSTMRQRSNLFARETPGSIQLWQFLLDLLVAGEEQESIQWFGEPGEFRLLNPERVAVLWGQRKKKVSMNYEKMSRALRYYYDGDILGKVPGKHFTYKFVCDIKEATGYSFDELTGVGGSSGSVSCPSSPATSIGHESLADSDGSVDLSVRKKSRHGASLTGALDLRHMQERLSSA